jgi:hypothetical protein
MTYPMLRRGDRIRLPRESFEDPDSLPEGWAEGFRPIAEVAVVSRGLLAVRFEDGTRARVPVHAA